MSCSAAPRHVRWHLRWQFLLVATLVGCADATAPVAPSSTTPPGVPRAAVTDPCAASDAHNARVRARGEIALAEARRRGDVKDGWEQPPLPPLPCVRTPGGAWTFEAGELSHGGVTSAPLTLVHVDGTGTRAELAVEVPEGVPLAFTCCHPTTELHDVRAVDLDGRGELELALSVTHHDPEGGVAIHTTVLGLEGGVVVVRRPPAP